jgi:tRNA1(Val) A37 N6-methylase TrmN6
MIETLSCGIRLLTLPGEVMSPRPATELLVDAAAERIGDRPALVADANVCRHQLGERISVSRADLLDGVPAGLDLVVANLPYLAESLRTKRPELAGEPPEAVFAPGDGGGPYRRLIKMCSQVLRPDGALAVQFHRRVLVAEASQLSELRLAA